MKRDKGKHTYPVVVVEWEDASSHGSGWLSPGEVMKLHQDGVKVVSAGIEILRDKAGIVLATAVNGWDTSVGNVFRIPSTFLRKRTVVGKVKVKGEVKACEPML